MMTSRRSAILAAIAVALAGCTPESSAPGESASGAAQGSEANGIVITNARVIDGTGAILEQGTVVVRDGRIVSVSAEGADPAGALRIDARGMTVMPGFIDAHRHVISGNPAEWLEQQAVPRMQEYLDAGITTIQSCGDPLDQIIELRGKLADGTIKGPRLYAAGFMPLAGGGPMGEGGVDPARAPSSWAPRVKPAPAIPAEQTRALIQKYKVAGVDALKTVLVVTPKGPETDTLKLIVAEAKPLGLPVITHAVTVIDTVAAVDAGVTTLVHTPVDGEMTEAVTRKIAQSGIPMMSTLGVFTPFYGKDGEALFRDGTPFPWERLYHGGEGAVNARLLWNAGVVYGFGTDTPFGGNTGFTPHDTLAHELQALKLVFSPKDIVTIMTRNAAVTAGHPQDVGTLEAGKLADIVMLDGDPLTNIDAVLSVKMVIKDGKVVVDKR